MSDERYDYDPGTPYDPPPRRRRRPDYKRDSEYDDAWAAADEAGDEHGDDAIEGLAAGYHWEDDPRYGVRARDERTRAGWRDRTSPDPRNPDRHPNVRAPHLPADLGPLPSSVRRVRDRRPPAARYDYAPLTDRYDPHRSPTYHRDRARRIEYGEYYDPQRTVPPEATRRSYPASFAQGGVRGLPYWQILAIVLLSVLALLAAALACASVLLL